MADYGTDLAALDDLPDLDALVSGDLNVAHALCRRLLTAPGALAEIGETEPYESINLRDYIGARLNAQEERDIARAADAAIKQDPRVESATVAIDFTGRKITATVQGSGTEGPFDLVLSVDGVNVTLLRNS